MLDAKNLLEDRIAGEVSQPYAQGLPRPFRRSRSLPVTIMLSQYVNTFGILRHLTVHLGHPEAVAVLIGPPPEMLFAEP